MAELIGKSLVTYSKKERGEVEFSNEEMSIVAKALDLTSDQSTLFFSTITYQKGKYTHGGLLMSKVERIKGGKENGNAMPQKPVKTSASGVGKKAASTTISSVAVKVLRNCSESRFRALRITSWAIRRSSRWIRWC